jgi:hypothetical protein
MSSRELAMKIGGPSVSQGRRAQAVPGSGKK